MQGFTGQAWKLHTRTHGYIILARCSTDFQEGEGDVGSESQAGPRLGIFATNLSLLQVGMMDFGGYLAVSPHKCHAQREWGNRDLCSDSESKGFVCFSLSFLLALESVQLRSSHSCPLTQPTLRSSDMPGSFQQQSLYMLFPHPCTLFFPQSLNDWSHPHLQFQVTCHLRELAPL